MNDDFESMSMTLIVINHCFPIFLPLSLRSTPSTRILSPQVQPVYKDPIHDFAFLRFNPSEVRFTDIKGKRIPLCPDELETGTEVRVVGNDNGEKLQILPGIIGRVDRNVPAYASTINQVSLC